MRSDTQQVSFLRTKKEKNNKNKKKNKRKLKNKNKKKKCVVSPIKEEYNLL